MTTATVMAVVVGGAIGAPLRFIVDRAVTARVVGASGAALFPWGLLVVNVLGSLLAGVVATATTGDVRVLLLVGVCGGFTTFSGYAWETERLWPLARAAFWLSVTVVPVACVGAFLVGRGLTAIVIG